MNIDTFQPIIDEVMKVLAIFIAGLLVTLLVKAQNWVKAHTTKNQQAVLNEIAGNVYAIVEREAKRLGIREKMNQAVKKAQDELKKRNIKLDDKTIEGAIEKFHLEFKAKLAEQKAKENVLA
jgi:membrane protein insertase Oxa1/YidC/SpoIIIJ